MYGNEKMAIAKAIMDFLNFGPEPPLDETNPDSVRFHTEWMNKRDAAFKIANGIESLVNKMIENQSASRPAATVE